MFLRVCHRLSSVISVGNIPNHRAVGYDGTFGVVGELEAGCIEVAATAVFRNFKDVVGQLTLNGENDVGGIGGAIVNIVPHQTGEVSDIALDVLVDFHVHVNSFLL